VKLVATRDQGFTNRNLIAPRRVIASGSAPAKTAGSRASQHEAGRLRRGRTTYSVAGVEDSASLMAFGAVKDRRDNGACDRNTPGSCARHPVVPYISALVKLDG